MIVCDIEMSVTIPLNPPPFQINRQTKGSSFQCFDWQLLCKTLIKCSLIFPKFWITILLSFIHIGFKKMFLNLLKIIYENTKLNICNLFIIFLLIVATISWLTYTKKGTLNSNIFGLKSFNGFRFKFVRYLHISLLLGPWVACLNVFAQNNSLACSLFLVLDSCNDSCPIYIRPGWPFPRATGFIESNKQIPLKIYSEILHLIYSYCMLQTTRERILMKEINKSRIGQSWDFKIERASCYSKNV